jgi:hypothetical protein
MDRQLDGDRILRFPDGDPVKLSGSPRSSIVPIFIATLVIMVIGCVVGIYAR